MTLPAFRLWEARESHPSKDFALDSIPHLSFLLRIHSESDGCTAFFPPYLRVICTKSFCSPATESAGPLPTLRPLSPSTTASDIGVAPVVGRVKRGKKENKKRNPSLDWTVLSISLPPSLGECSHSLLSIHPSLPLLAAQ